MLHNIPTAFAARDRLISKERLKSIIMSQNIDPTEVSKFGEQAANWWDPAGPLKTLHHINPLRLKFIQDRALLNNKKVIDVGCGGGILTESLALQNAETTGIDMSQESLKTAILHAQTSNLTIRYLETTAEEMAQQSANTFDVVTCLELLEHVPDPSSLIKACATLTKPGGHVFFSTINRTPKAYLFAVLGAEYLLKLLPKGTHDYAKFVRPSELAAWARTAGLELQDFAGLAYNPITQQARLISDLNINYLGHFQKHANF